MSVSLMDIKSELVVNLRNQDLISISDRGVTTVTEEFNGDGNTKQFQFSNTNVKNVRSVTIDAGSMAFGIDYTVDYVNAQINFTVAPGSGTDNVDISLDFGSQDRIFPDFPQPHLKLSDFPRIAVDIISSTSNEIGIGAAITESDYTVSIICYATNQTVVENLVSGVKDFIMANKKSLFYSPFITPTSTGPLLVTEFGQNKILQRNQDAEVRFEFNGI